MQAVATHELGHWLALKDLYDSGDTEKTMYYGTALGEIKKRSLESDDIAGIKSISGAKSGFISSDYSIDGIKLENSADKSINTDELLDINLGATVLLCTHKDLKNGSDMIVTGKVKEILPSKWNTIDGEKPSKVNTHSDQVCIIYTDIIVDVDRYLKNTLPSKEVIVRTYGGKVGNDKMKLDIEARFKPGEKVLLYLEKDTSPMTNIGSEHFFVYGSMQGKFTLTDDGKATRQDENTTLDELLKNN